MRSRLLRAGLCLLITASCSAAVGAEPKIDKAFISFRISSEQWMPQQRFRELLDLFEKHKGVTDEVTFFHSVTHAPIPLEEVKKRVQVLGQRMPEVRKLGYRTGINILTTIGHHDENLPNSLVGDYTPMTDVHGNVCRGSRCPNDENMRRYIKELYRIVASAAPDYIWIDDDVRLAGHMPIHLTKTRFTSEALPAASGGLVAKHQ